ncbi:hypothetical protein [Burkholderia sp. Ax-1719]|uniref:hypothetical protein n=1 Tax=Burkholderia sp. Ax-1719 TaxID=2608334 RepID=UPI0014213E9A|nr:hypothetical protein [Burkholderia sp. Ax-1719]NIE66975.1 hypothetical protein [Burkholderia sp. Ax-1719]
MPPRVIRALILLVALATAALAHAQQVGFISNGVYYSVNPQLANGTTLQIVPDVDHPAVQCCATISGRAHANPNVFDDLRDRAVTAYAIKLPPALDKDVSGFGVTGEAHFAHVGKTADATLEGGLMVRLATCTSGEGVHYLGKRIGDGKTLVHLSQHFDADFEPTCSDADLEPSAK